MINIKSPPENRSEPDSVLAVNETKKCGNCKGSTWLNGKLVTTENHHLLHGSQRVNLAFDKIYKSSPISI